MRRLLAILLCGWLTTICSWAGDSIASQLSYRRFTTLDGLPQMQAETVFQDSEGYVWIGTLSGFVRYDGRTLTPFLKGQRENIVAITETAEGVSGLGFRRQWLVDGDKVTMRFIDPDQQWLTNNADADQHWLLNNFNSTDLPIGIILLEDEQETHRTLARLTEDGWTPLLKAGVFDLMMPDRKMYIDDDDIYVPTEKGLYVVRHRKWRLLTAKDDFFALTRMEGKLYALAADGIYCSMTDNRRWPPLSLLRLPTMVFSPVRGTTAGSSSPMPTTSISMTDKTYANWPVASISSKACL